MKKISPGKPRYVELWGIFDLSFVVRAGRFTLMGDGLSSLFLACLTPRETQMPWPPGLILLREAKAQTLYRFLPEMLYRQCTQDI